MAGSAPISTRLALRVAIALLILPLAHQVSESEERGGGHFIIRYAPGASEDVTRSILKLGGLIKLDLPIIRGVAANLTADAKASLERDPNVTSITPDQRVTLSHRVDGYDASTFPSSMYNLNGSIRARELWAEGITGAGVDVALIDSGIVRVNGLSRAGKVVNGPDVSFESQASNLRYLDTFGHGTHMAGIIAGRDDGAETLSGNHDDFIGVAPDARIVSIKVADAQGTTDVSQVIAGINWVVEHRNEHGLNIRVLNLSFGTDGLQDYALDPLSYAAEVAWRKGIVVVVAAGNSAFGTSRLNNPAYDPHVIAVGAADTKGTPTTLDDTVPPWSALGDGVRNPDFVAPGVSVVALRNPGSNIDLTYPGGAVNARFFKGSGTSQSAAFTSGAAALLLQHRPWLTPGQVKELLKSTASRIPGVDSRIQGSGLINLRQAKNTSPSALAVSAPAHSSGLGTLEGSRGSIHVALDGEPLTGERDIHGLIWDAETWSVDTLYEKTWKGGQWRGVSWTGSGFEGDSWSATAWTGNTWTGRSWSSFGWSGNTWTGNTWTGNTWTGNTWTGNTWTGNTWTGQSWNSSCTVTTCPLEPASWSGILWPAFWGV